MTLVLFLGALICWRALAWRHYGTVRVTER